MRKLVYLPAILAATVWVLGGCTSVGSLGVITKTSADPAAALKSSRGFEELGPAQGRACRLALLGVLPMGNADIQTATDRALKETRGNALVNVTTSNSLYGFFPIYNVFAVTCTQVKGTAVRYYN